MQLLPIATLRALSVDEQDKLARESVKLEGRAKASAKEVKSAFPAIGKVVCIVEERLNDLKTERKIASNTSLATFWTSITKAPINNHALSCAVAFGTFVRTELISERDYDKNTAQCLELAASISTAVGGDVTHEAVAHAAAELQDRSKDSAKNLREILADVKEPKKLTDEQADKLLDRLMQDGHLVRTVSRVGAEIAHLEDADVAKTTFFAMDGAMSLFAKNMDAKGARRFDDDTLNEWASELGTVLQQNAPEPEAAAA